MTTLVTGASGMLGANLCKRLAEAGEEVRSYTRAPLEHPFLRDVRLQQAIGGLDDREALGKAMHGCGKVYHVAGLVSYADRDAAALQRVNVDGTRTVLEAAREAGVRRLVVTSSTAAIGIPDNPDVPLAEDAPFPRAFERVAYMRTKRDAERLALSFAGIEVVAVNPATIYGAGDVKGNTGFLFRKIRNGMLFRPPGGTGVVSVRDCVEGHLLAMEKGTPGQRYILCEGNYPFGEIFAAIAGAVGARPPSVPLPSWLYPFADAGLRMACLLGKCGVPMTLSPAMAAIAFRKRYFDGSKARRELGWKPSQSLKDMMAEAAAFYLEQGMLYASGFPDRNMVC